MPLSQKEKQAIVGHICLSKKTRRHEQAGRSDIASICQEIRELSDISFTSFQISFVSRLANQAAHSIASKASSIRRRCLWLNYTPQFLASTVEIDCKNSEWSMKLLDSKKKDQKAWTNFVKRTLNSLPELLSKTTNDALSQKEPATMSHICLSRRLKARTNLWKEY
jgi:hypothetical protein